MKSIHLTTKKRKSKDEGKILQLRIVPLPGITYGELPSGERTGVKSWIAVPGLARQPYFVCESVDEIEQLLEPIDD